MENIKELLKLEIKALYSSQKQLTEVLPSLAEAATHKKLKKHLQKYLKKSEKHLERIQKVCRKMDINPGNAKSNAMEGLLQDSAGLMGKISNPEVTDAALVSTARKACYLQQVGYESAYRQAKALELKKVSKKLKKSYKSQQKTAGKLRKLEKKKIIENL